MNFICTPCKQAADFDLGDKPLFDGQVLEVKERQHSRCLGGTHCDCQHKVGGTK